MDLGHEVGKRCGYELCPAYGIFMAKNRKMWIVLD